MYNNDSILLLFILLLFIRMFEFIYNNYTVHTKY